MTEPRYRVELLDESDADEVYKWAYGSCQKAPLAALAAIAGSPAPTREEIINAIANEFPNSTRESARAGARAGFEARSPNANNDRNPPDQPARRVIRQVALDPERHAATGNTRHYFGNALYKGGFSGLHIVQYENDDAHYLVYLGPDGNELTDTWHQSLGDALQQAETEFGVQPAEWSDSS
jgi:hypothetical protein